MFALLASPLCWKVLLLHGHDDAFPHNQHNPGTGAGMSNGTQASKRITHEELACLVDPSSGHPIQWNFSPYEWQCGEQHSSKPLTGVGAERLFDQVQVQTDSLEINLSISIG